MSNNGQYSQKELAGNVISSRVRNLEDPSLNPASLAGQISMKDMGTRAHKEETPSIPTPQEVEEPQKTAFSLENDLNLEDISYRPTSAETAAVFEQFTAEIRKYIPDESHSTILSAADLALEALKDEIKPLSEKRAVIDELLSTKLTNEQLGDLVQISNEISDYGPQEDEEPEKENPLAIDFEEEEEEKPHAAVIEEESTEAAEKAEVPLEEPTTIVAEPEKAAEELPLDQIKPDFLYSTISGCDSELSDEEAKERTKKVSRLLFDKNLSQGELEKSLPEIFEFQHLDVVKTLLVNRWRIYGQVRKVKEEPETEKPTESRKRSLDEEEQPAKLPKKETRQPRIVDLEGLVFDQGSHLMASSKVVLPKGSYQQSKKLYDVISVPAPEAPPPAEESELVKISELPDWAQAAFPSHETQTLNRIQSKIYPKAFLSDENLLLCAPTGAGKTNVAMLTFLRLLGEHRGDDGKIDLSAFKAVYVAPLKALVAEQTREFQRRLTAQYGVVVNELTGDLSLSQREIAETQVLFTTPEKWDVVTRKPENKYLQLVKLLIIDEIHLLHDDRGPVLESLAVRTKRNPKTRIVGLSATLPNYEDVAQFIHVQKSGLFYFDATFRPCPLEQQFIGIKEKKAIKKVAAMNEACFEKVKECLENRHQVIIFVHSRKDTFKTAKYLREKIAEDKNLEDVLLKGSGNQAVLREESEKRNNKNLSEILPAGLGIHHAGLNKDDRTTTEDLFAQGHISVLVSTATLAWGVNLPAHTVVIKGTDTYNPEKGAWQQLSPQDILQMLGRAGRPRYDKSGEGVIITAHEELQYYMAVLNQQLPIELQLMSRLADNLNAEVANGLVRLLEDAVAWLGETYLFIRMRKNRKLYQVGPEYEDDTDLKWKRTDLVHTALTVLAESGLVSYGEQVKITELGKIAANFYISCPTVALYNNTLRPWMTEIDILRLFARSGEFKYVPVRQEEKLEVTKLAEKCPIAIKDAPLEPLAKINVLLQSYIAHLKLDGFALLADMIYVVQLAGRLLRAIHEICLKRKWAQVLLCTLELCKVVEKRTWPTSSPFRQFGDLASADVIRATEASHLPFVSYFDLTPAELAEAVNFRGKASEAYDLLQQFPRLDIEAHAQPLLNDLLRVSVDVLPNWQWNDRIHGKIERFLLLVEDVNGETILYSDGLAVNLQSVHRTVLLDVFVSISEPVPPNLFVTVVSEKWLNCKWRAPVKLFHTVLPKKPLSVTPLADVQNISVSALGEFSEKFDFSFFNKFQSQCFHLLWNTNENVLVALAKGTGKTACAELAILNCWRQNMQRVVYLQPSQLHVDLLCELWSRRFSGLTDPPKKVAKLTGDLQSDIRIQASSHLVLATPQQFDVLSRRWRQRKAVQLVDLVVADDVHLVSGGTGDIGVSGASYEAVLSRLRLMAAHVKPARIVALSNPLLYARDVADWLGCLKQHTFNFGANERFSPPKEMVLSPYDDQPPLKLPGGPCLVFVPNRKAAHDVVVNLVEENAEKLLADSTTKKIAESVSDRQLRSALSHRIGLLFDTMAEKDRKNVAKLWHSGQLDYVIATRGSAFTAPQANNVVIWGTHEAEVHQNTPYLLSEFLEMAGTAIMLKVEAFCSRDRLGYFTKFLSCGMPMESYLSANLHDAFLHEIAARTVKSRQDCVDWLTFTLFYKRLMQNPSFYGLKEVTNDEVSEFLSDLVEKTLDELTEAELIEFDDDDEEMEPLNGAMIATHYDVAFATMKSLGKLSGKARLRNLIEAVSAASEFENLPFRPGEELVLAKIAASVPFKLPQQAVLESPQAKVYLLLQAHLSRIPLPADLASDQQKILQAVLNVVFATVDTLSGEGHLNALQAMDLSQMIVQGIWNRESPLKQIPYFSDEMVDRGKKYDVETVYDIMALEDDERDDVLQLEGDRLHRIADFVNSYPNIDVKYELALEEKPQAGEPVQITVTVERDEEMDSLEVVSDRFPGRKLESWWIVVGDAKSRQLYGIRKTAVAHESQDIKLSFSVPTAGLHELTIWCMCDSYLDADKEMSFVLEVE